MPFYQIISRQFCLCRQRHYQALIVNGTYWIEKMFMPFISYFEAKKITKPSKPLFHKIHLIGYNIFNCLVFNHLFYFIYHSLYHFSTLLSLTFSPSFLFISLAPLTSHFLFSFPLRFATQYSIYRVMKFAN